MGRLPTVLRPSCLPKSPCGTCNMSQLVSTPWSTQGHYLPESLHTVRSLFLTDQLAHTEVEAEKAGNLTKLLAASSDETMFRAISKSVRCQPAHAEEGLWRRNRY
jgi:hypothetical protein